MNFEKKEYHLAPIGKQGKGGLKTFGLAFLAFLVVGMVFGGLWKYGILEQSTTPEAKKENILETSNTQPTLRFNVVDKYAKSTAISPNVVYKVGKTGNIQVDMDGTISVNCHDSVEYFVNATGFYGAHGTVDDVPCTSNPSVDVELMAYDTTPDVQIYNQDDGTLNSATASEALGANNVDTQTVKIYPTFRRGIQGAHVYFDVVVTNVDTITSSLGSSIGQPSVFTHNSSAGRTTADEVYIFPVPSLEYKDSIVTLTATVDMGGTAYGLNNGTIDR